MPLPLLQKLTPDCRIGFFAGQTEAAQHREGPTKCMLKGMLRNCLKRTPFNGLLTGRFAVHVGACPSIVAQYEGFFFGGRIYGHTDLKNTEYGHIW